MEMGKGKGRIRADCCQAGCRILLWLAKRRGTMWRWHERLPGPALETAWGGGREALWRFSSGFSPLHILITLLLSRPPSFSCHITCCFAQISFISRSSSSHTETKDLIWVCFVCVWTSHWIPGDSSQCLCIIHVLEVICLYCRDY